MKRSKFLPIRTHKMLSQWNQCLRKVLQLRTIIMRIIMKGQVGYRTQNSLMTWNSQKLQNESAFRLHFTQKAFFPHEKFLTSILHCKIPFMQALLIVCAQNMELPITGLLLSFAIISEESQEFSIDCRSWFKSLSNSIYNYTWSLLLSDILIFLADFGINSGQMGLKLFQTKSTISTGTHEPMPSWALLDVLN